MSPAQNGGPVQPSASTLRPLGPDEITITGGFWGHHQRQNAEATLPHCEAWMERIGWISNFDRAADGTAETIHTGVTFTDSEVYKLLEAMAWEIDRHADPDLKHRYELLVARVARAQEADGYLHTAFGRPGQRARYSDMEWGHELYCFGHLIQAAVARLRTGHDDLLPQLARRLADHVIAEFGPSGRVAICGHPEIEVALAELGRALGEHRYVDMARLLIERRGHGLLGRSPFGQEYFQDDTPFRTAGTMRGHAVRSLYLACGAIDVATETADHELAEAVARQWANAVARRTYITGGAGSHHLDEAYGADFELPADRAYSESCAGIASVMLSWRLLLATGDEKYAGVMERTLLNNVLASLREDGRAFFYTNTLHQREPGSIPDEDEPSSRAHAGLRAPWFDVSCCPTNLARTLAAVGLYFATATDEGIQLHQYGDYQVRAATAAGRVVLAVASEYPFGGHIAVTVAEAPSTAVTIRLRIPSWAPGARLRTHRATRQAPSYVEVHKVFHPGEIIRLDLPVEARITYPDPRIDAVRGSFAVERGPLVLAVESADLPPGWSVNDLEADPETVAPSGDGARIDVYRRAAPTAAWPYYNQADGTASESARIQLIPYLRWANRGPASMRIWLPHRRAGGHRIATARSRREHGNQDHTPD